MNATAEATIANAALRGVVDLREFAADPHAGEPSRETGDAWFTGRRVLPGGDAIVIAALMLDGSGRVGAMPADEFVFVLSGRLTVIGTDTQSIEVDHGAMLPQGISFDWHAEAGTHAIVMRYTGHGGGADGMVAVDLTAALNPSSPPAADVLLSAAPSCRSHTDYASSNGEFMCGVWDSTPYHRQHIDYRHGELMHLLAGSVTFEDREGNARTFRAGDLFVVLPGARCSWLSVEDCAKLWVIYRPAAN